MFSREMFSVKVIDDFEDKGFTFNHKAEMHFITIAHKKDMIYDFCFKHKICGQEWKLDAIINKNKSLIIKFNHTWHHLLNGKFESYCLLKK